MKQILAIIASALALVLGIWQAARQRAEIRRKRAEKAKEDLENANKNDDPGGFLDAFGGLR